MDSRDSRDRRASPSVDVAVIGGGPAGATAARLLAEWGYDVALLVGPGRTGPRRAGARQAESLPPSTRALLDALRLIEPIDRAGFLRSTGNTVWWGTDAPRIERFASSGDATGYQIPRAAFDDLLLTLAESSGVRIFRNTIVRDVDFGEPDAGPPGGLPQRKDSTRHPTVGGAAAAAAGSGFAGDAARGGANVSGQDGAARPASFGGASTDAAAGSGFAGDAARGGANVSGQDGAARPASFGGASADAAAGSGFDRDAPGVREAGRGSELASVECAGAGDVPWRIGATFVIDCSGRAGVLARRGWRREEPGHRTAAIAAAWRAEAGWGLTDESHTLVEAFDEGWAWSIPASRELRIFTVMVDPDTWRAGARGYAAAMARTRHLRALLPRGAMDGAPWGADASLYFAERCAGPRRLLAGDAATVLDPLSSFGIKKALASAWMAAIVANTSLARPPLAAAARALYDAREREMYDAGLAGTVAFARDAVAAFPASAFWRARAGTDLTGRDSTPLEDRCRQDPAVRAAFERLRATDGARLRTAETAERPWRASRPIVQGREIVLADAVRLPLAPDGVRHLGGVNLPALLDLARDQTRDVPSLFDAYRRAQPAPLVELAPFLAAIAVLLAAGALKIVSSASSS